MAPQKTVAAEQRAAESPVETQGSDAHAAAAAHLAAQMKALHRSVSGRMMEAMQEQLHGDEMSFSQMSALHQLRSHAPVSVGGLAELTGLSLPAASHLMDKLVVRGYAQRRENPDDRRAKLLDLSERGRQFLDSMDRRFTEGYQVAFAQVSWETVQAAADSVQALLLEMQASVPRTSVPRTSVPETSAPKSGLAPPPESPGLSD